VGVRHTLFPRTLAFGARASPVECRMAASFPTLRGPARTMQAIPVRPRSGAGLPRARVPAGRLFLGEASGPGLQHACRRARFLTRLGGVAEFVPQPGRCPQGRHPAIRRDRWPCATGLASYPSSCVCLVFRKQAIAGVRRLLRSELVAGSVVANSRELRGGSERTAHSVTACPPCAFRLRHRNLPTA
jgi:hypothetical protein